MTNLVLILINLVFAATDLVQAPEWTFKAKREVPHYALGLKKPEARSRARPSLEFLTSEAVLPDKFHLKDMSPTKELSPIRDQKQCGSCVYHSVTANFQDALLLRGVGVDLLSTQWLMSCAAPNDQCNGSYFEEVAGGLNTKKGQALEADYPYKAQTLSCSKTPKLYGQIQSYKIIDNSPKSIMTALVAGYPVSVTVGAGGSWMSYDSGVFNACSNVGTNHETVLVGYDCEGPCVFDGSGKLPAGKGQWVMRNSWGLGWGEQGYMRTKITSSSGSLCNNLAEEAGILEVGIDPKPPVPPIPPVPPVPPTPVVPGLPLYVYLIGGILCLLVVVFAVGAFRKKE